MVGWLALYKVPRVALDNVFLAFNVLQIFGANKVRMPDSIQPSMGCATLAPAKCLGSPVNRRWGGWQPSLQLG